MYIHTMFCVSIIGVHAHMHHEGLRGSFLVVVQYAYTCRTYKLCMRLLFGVYLYLYCVFHTVCSNFCVDHAHTSLSIRTIVQIQIGHCRLQLCET